MILMRSVDAAFLPLLPEVEAEQCFGLTIRVNDAKELGLSVPLPRIVAKPLPHKPEIGNDPVFKVGANSGLIGGHMRKPSQASTAVCELLRLHNKVHFKEEDHGEPVVLRNMHLVESEDMNESFWSGAALPTDTRLTRLAWCLVGSAVMEILSWYLLLPYAKHCE